MNEGVLLGSCASYVGCVAKLLKLFLKKCGLKTNSKYNVGFLHKLDKRDKALKCGF